MRVFITGATGFAGSYLVEDLLAAGHEVFALYHPSTSHQALPSHPLLQHVEGDLLELASLKTAVFNARPDFIYHLAGQAYPARSWQDPAFTLAMNAGGTANMLEAAVKYGRPRMVVVTSAEIYGPIQPEHLPLTEDTPPMPRHPYGVSKWTASQLVALYWRQYQLPVVEARPFNHIGPRQALGFVVPDFASQIARIKLGVQPPQLLVGNLEAERDFTDVRDVVRAYQLLAEGGQPGSYYLICSGQAVSIRHILDTLIEIAGVNVDIQFDPDRMRPSDTARLFGSYAKIQQSVGWQPVIPLTRSLADAFEHWVGKVAMEREGNEPNG